MLSLLFSLLSLWLLLFLWSSSIFFELFQSIHGDLGSGSNTGGKFVSSSSESDLAAFALPDSTWNSLDGSLNNYAKCTFPHAGQTYLACCWSSNFLTIFLMAPPYLVPYFPTIPTFFVLLAIMDFNYLIYYFSNLLFLLYLCVFTFLFHSLAGSEVCPTCLKEPLKCLNFKKDLLNHEFKIKQLLICPENLTWWIRVFLDRFSSLIY